MGRMRSFINAICTWSRVSLHRLTFHQLRKALLKILHEATDGTDIINILSMHIQTDIHIN